MGWINIPSKSSSRWLSASNLLLLIQEVSLPDFICKGSNPPQKLAVEYDLVEIITTFILSHNLPPQIFSMRC